MGWSSSRAEIREEDSEGVGCSHPRHPSEVERKKQSTRSIPKPYRAPFLGDIDHRNQVVLEHLPQVKYLARRIHDRLPRYVPIEDLVHSGVLGLIEALYNYDPSKNVQVKSYAKARIQGAILDSLRALDWGPRTLRKRARQIDRAHHTLGTRLGRFPSEGEIAAELGMGLAKFQHLLAELHRLEVVSLQSLGPEDSYRNDASSFLPQETVDDPVQLCLRSEMSELLSRAMAGLSPRKRQVLALYYGEGLTMKEVGARLGVGESRVSQIHSAALVRLRARMRLFLESSPRSRPLWSTELESLTQGNWEQKNNDAAHPCLSSTVDPSSAWEGLPPHPDRRIPWRPVDLMKAGRIQGYKVGRGSAKPTSLGNDRGLQGWRKARRLPPVH